MAYFAELDQENTVLRNLAVADHDCRDSDGFESEEAGREFLNRVVGEGRWIQTSFTGRIRKHFALPGYVYVERLDMFVKPKPGENFQLDENGDWVETI